MEQKGAPMSGKQTIHLGFEVGTGASVYIPLKHTVITGQTQDAGKTTALEALISRAGLRALTFVTKRGEGSFRGARRIDPYFREQADWQFVASILEASRGEKLKYERASIIKMSKGARTLADVHRNIKTALAGKRPWDEKALVCLDAYLEAVVPFIAEVKWATSVDLRPGVNVMDLTDLNVEMQHLVIRSSLDWVLNKEKDTIVVVPEAWKFIPQGRGTPVKLMAEAYIRQGAALRNFLWLDSQDITGVEKLILKSIPVWALGVQRESNEIEHTLDQIPAGTKKPNGAEVATLGLGEFFACHGKHINKTYVWPEWMREADAIAIAKGEKNIDDVAQPKSKPAPASVRTEPQKPEKEEQDMSESTDRKLDTLIELMQKNLAGVPPTRPVRPLPEPPTRPAPRMETPMVDGEESMYQRFKTRLLADLPSIAAGMTITVTPPEKLRKDFQREESNRIIAAARELRSLPKRVLKLLEAIGSDYVGQKSIADRLGRSSGGQSWMDLGKAIKELAGLGFVEVKERQGARKTLRDKIAADLTSYQATDADVEAVYQSVLHELATEADGD